MNATENSVETLTLPITGMTCASCQGHVERALRNTPGVTQADVNLLANRATIRFNPAATTPESLVHAIEEAGYEATLPAPDGHAMDMDADMDMMTMDMDGPHVLPRAILALIAAATSMVLSMPLMMQAQTSSQTQDPLLNWVNHALAPLMPQLLMDLPPTPVRWFLLLITAAVMLLASPQTYTRAWQAARHRATNMNTLVAIGTLAAFGWSGTATIAPGLFTRHGIAPDVYFEAVSFILAFLLLGSVLDARAKHNTQAALTAFSQLQSTSARVLRNGIETEIPIADLHPGETVQLKPGERVPVDGVVLTGTSSVDESLLTGESNPVLKHPGDKVIGGTINLDGPLTLRATTLGQSSVLAQLRRLLADAQSSRAPMQRLADRASAIFVPAVLALALFTLIAWIAFAPDHSIPRAFAISIAVLVIACPCAMGLAVPAAQTVGIGRAAQLGFLVKNGEALERLAETTTIALDKTGTLTLGQPRITAAHFAPDTDQQQALALAAALERHSEHPLAKAVLAYTSQVPLLDGVPHLRDGLIVAKVGLAPQRDRLPQPSPNGLPVETMIAPPPDLHLTAIKTIPGQGVTATFNNQPVAIGNATLIQSAPPATQSATTLYLTLNNTLILTLEAEDTLRPTAAEAITELRKLQIAPLMLTGDNPATAAAIAREAGLTPAETRSSLLPQDKLTAIKALQQQGQKVAMAGDGLNDAAALAQADTGLAISSGTDLTREAADVILLTPDLTSIPTAIRLARRTLRTMRQNLGWAAAYNIIGIPIAAGVLYPHFHILLSPILASAAMALSSTSVLLNSLRLHRFR